MSRAVRFDHDGPVEVLGIVEIPQPTPGPAEVLVEASEIVGADPA